MTSSSERTPYIRAPQGEPLDYIARVHHGVTARVTSLSLCLFGTAAVSLGSWAFATQEFRSIPDALSWKLFIANEPSQALVMAVVCGLALIAPSGLIPTARVREVVARVGAFSGRVALVFMIVAAWLCCFAYQAKPFSMDEFAAVFQAKTFARGALAGYFPPALMDRLVAPAFIHNFFAVSDGRIAQVFWPGFAALLTPFLKAGIPWLLNPLLAALALLLIARLARQLLGDDESAGWAILFTIACPVFLANSISFYSLNTRLVFNLLFVHLLLKEGRHSTLFAGVAGSFALVAHNPFAHVAFALPWWISIAMSRGGFRRVGSLALGYAPLALLLGGGWALLLGDFENVLPGVKHYWDLHTIMTTNPMRVDEGWALRSINVARTVLWAMPGICVLAALGMRRPSGKMRLFGWSMFVTFLAYGLAANRLDQGLGWGYRYMYAAFPALPLLAASALKDEGEGAGSRSSWFLLALLSLAVCVPARLWQMTETIAHHHAQQTCLPAAVKHVCILSPKLPTVAADLVQNDPFLSEPRRIFLGRGMEEDLRFMSENFPDLEPSFDEKENSTWVRPQFPREASR